MIQEISIEEILEKIDMNNLEVVDIKRISRISIKKFENSEGGLKCRMLPSFKKYIWEHKNHFEFNFELKIIKHSFLENTKDKEILQIKNFNRISTKREILAIIYFLTREKPNYGHDYSIVIGYCICSDEKIKAIDISWDESKNEWDCGAHNLNEWLGSLDKNKDQILEIL